MYPPDAWASDIAVSAALALFAAYLEFQPPFERNLVSETLHRVSFPHTGEQTFPTWTLPFLGVFIPLGIIFVASLAKSGYDRTRKGRETKRAVVGLLLAVTLGFAVTNALKNSVGAFRPDFKNRCWPGEAVVRWDFPGVPRCSADHDPRLVSEGRKSFPSGHASIAFSGLSFAAAVVAKRLGIGGQDVKQTRNKRNKTKIHNNAAWHLVATVSPLALAAWVSVSRVTDYMHHVEDVGGGAVIGIVSAVAAWVAKNPFREEEGGDDVAKNTVAKKPARVNKHTPTAAATRPRRRRGSDSTEDHAPAGTRR